MRAGHRRLERVQQRGKLAERAVATVRHGCAAAIERRGAYPHGPKGPGAGCRYGEDTFVALKLVCSGAIEVVLADLVSVDDTVPRR